MGKSVVAYGDESMRAMGSERLYLLAGSVFQCDEDLLAKLSRLKGARAEKLHWRDLGRAAQAEAMEAIALAGPVTTVVIGSPMNPHKQERARRKCLEALVPLLASDGVTSLVLESRGAKSDLRDVYIMDALRSRGLAGDMRLAHRRGTDEPRLWVPDQILGAFGDGLCGEFGGDPRWNAAWRALESGLRMESVRL